MAKRKVYLHIGPPGPASDAIHRGLLQHRFALAGLGFHVPTTTPYDALAAEVELRRTHRDHGLKRREVEGTWARLTREAWKSERAVLLSVPGLAAGSADVAALALDALAGLQVHLVVTPSDPGTAVTSAWAAAVQHGRATSFAKFARRVLDPERNHDQAQEFWATHDLVRVLDIWAGRLKPERVHVVTVPPAGADADPHDRPGDVLAWERFGAVLGVDLPPAPEPTGRHLAETGARRDPRAEHTAAAAQIALLRRVNRSLDGRLAHPSYAPVVGELFGDIAPLALPDLAPDPRTAPLAGLLTEIGGRWVATLAERGYAVHGRSHDLLPVAPTVPDHPDDVGSRAQLEVATDVLAETLLELARVRREHDRLAAEHAALAEKRVRLRRRLAGVS